MSDSKTEAVPAADSTKPESESLPEETPSTAATESASSPKVEAEPELAGTQPDDTETRDEPEQSTSPSEPKTEDTPVDDKTSSEGPPKEEKEAEKIVKSDTTDASKTEASERKLSSASDKQEAKERKKSAESDVNEELQNMIKELSEPKVDENSEKNDKKQTGKETTENLISVLEDGIDGQTKENPAAESAPPAADAATAVKPPKPKKYLYKLKSKTGKILHYTSTVPITLKRPIIHLTKMVDTSNKPAQVQRVVDSEREDVDSDNSNVKENEAPNDNVMKVVRKKGRPPLSSRPPPPVITLDGNASDTSEDMKNKSTPSFSMQTRKRQLKFLPDGRLITPQKRVKSDDKSQSTSSSDSDIDIISDSERSAEPSAANKSILIKKSESGAASATTSTASSAASAPVATTSTASLAMPKKFKSEIGKLSNSISGEKRKYKKVFDYESYYREKTGTPSQSGSIRTPVGNRSFASNLTPIRKVTDTPKLKPILPSNAGTPKKTSSVDPAQLLSSLIGVPISSSQLNVVKFKPKIIQERTNTIIASTPKKVTFEDDKITKHGSSSNPSELLKSTPFKIVSKPTYQKILPKPSGNERTSITQTRMAYQPINIDNKFASPIPATNSLYVTSNSPFLRESLRDTLAKFETFTDSKVVKTKGGPKRAVKKKLDDDVFLKDNNTKTLYDLMYEIFEKMPSWNLHVVPDTKCFCIAQVSRGRMGIPTLKKSIEINSEFFAKVYVHQLQCKRYDGIYDTESKIVKLIKEIDALAA